MFKEIFIRIYQLIMRPSAAWQKMDEQGEVAQSLFFSRFLFPIMGIAALSCFGNVLGEEFNAQTLEYVLRLAIVEFVKFFIGFYFLVFFIERNPTVLFGSERKGAYRAVRRFFARFIHDGRYCRKYTAERLFFLEYAVLGIFYVIWTGAKIFLHIDDSKQRTFTLIVTIIVLVVPIIVERILYLMMPGINR